MRSQIYTETACALAVARDPSFFGRRDCINPRMFCDTRRSSETKSIHLCDISCKQRSFVSVGHQFSDSRYGPVKLPTAAFMSPAPPSVNKRSSMRLPNLYNDHYIDITTVSCVTDYGIRVALLCSSRWHSPWSWPVQYCVSNTCQRCVTNDGAV